MTEASQVAQRVESASRPRAGGPRVGVSLVSVASAAPAAVISNAAVAARLGVDARWVETRTGVRERRIARDGETVVSLGVEAARGALERADLAADAVDLVLVATMTPDDITPNAAPLVAAGVGAQGAFVADGVLREWGAP